jgi:hypothetical protein
VSRPRCEPVAAAAVAALLAACAGTDPCAGAATCMLLDVDAVGIDTIDQLELDVIYADHHGTVTTGVRGNPVSLPITVPVHIDLPGTPLIQIDILAAGRLDGHLLGADAVSTTVQQGHDESHLVLLTPVSPCTEGALYCGGFAGILAAIRTLYRCTDGLPVFYARCSFACSPFLDEPAVCDGEGLCRDGGTYCGGHAVNGDPGTLYVCMDYHATMPRPCPHGCLVRGDGDDVCN